MLHRFVFNLKRILAKAGLGGRLGTFAVALGLLIREDKSYLPYKNLIESAVIKYLKETNQYENMLNEIRDIPDIDDKPVMTCLGVGIYEQNNKLVSEYEYAKTL